jgi:hypothetical protein
LPLADIEPKPGLAPPGRDNAKHASLKSADVAIELNGPWRRLLSAKTKNAKAIMARKADKCVSWRVAFFKRKVSGIHCVRCSSRWDNQSVEIVSYRAAIAKGSPTHARASCHLFEVALALRRPPRLFRVKLPRQ